MPSSAFLRTHPLEICFLFPLPGAYSRPDLVLTIHTPLQNNPKPTHDSDMIFHMYLWPLEQTRPMMRWARPWPPGWPPPTPTLVEATMRNALLLLVVVVAALEVEIVLILLHLVTIIFPLFLIIIVNISPSTPRLEHIATPRIHLCEDEFILIDLFEVFLALNTAFFCPPALLLPNLTIHHNRDREQN